MITEAQEQVIREMLKHCTAAQRRMFESLYPEQVVPRALFGRAVLLIERLIVNRARAH